MPEQDNLFRIFWANLRKTGGNLLLVGPFLVMILLFIISPISPVKFSSFLMKVIIATIILILFLSAVIIITLFNTILILDKERRNMLKLPKFIEAREYPRSSGQYIYIFEPSELLGQGSIISIYYIDNNFEPLIAMGVVTNVQTTNKNIVVSIIYIANGYENIINEVNNDNRVISDSIIIKPTVNQEFFEGIARGF